MPYIALKKMYACVFSEGTPFSWWVGGADPGQVQTYWGGAQPGSRQCACGLQDNCLDPNHYCNCDADYDQWYHSPVLLLGRRIRRKAVFKLSCTHSV